MVSGMKFIDQSKFVREEGYLTESKYVTQALKNDIIGRKAVTKQLNELGFQLIQQNKKYFFENLKLVDNDGAK